ncbi:B- and T-lymphocyte attenuator-like isoform X1 [Amphiprion ocellaris]|uniref:B- and T-lymphocyte attenuator-like isoform X1 n=1 Tax=Amphiprion ocellaris TaxID=80972 RepID=UPI000C3147D7|nr:B- and T-lymphocyte attenuator-like isoform X1 [Amphiprion ocellaris]
MKADGCRTFLLVLILAVLVFTLDGGDSEDEECTTEFKVRRNTVYKALVGQELRINCTIVFCNSSTTVSWYKFEGTYFPVDVSSSSHIKTEWKMLKELEGISFLVFPNILRSDSGNYQCRSGRDVSHIINVTVYGDVELSTVTPTTQDSVNTAAVDIFWPFVYRTVGLMVLVIIGISIWIIPKRACKGKSQSTTDPSLQPQHHIYENDL